jgi:hypothetical protein
MISRIIACFCLVLLPRASAIYGQDTISPSTTCYADILDDWKEQDTVSAKGYRAAMQAIISMLTSANRAQLQSRLNALTGAADTAPAMMALYARVCSERRSMRMAPYIDKFGKIVFSQHGVRDRVFNNVAGEAGGKLTLLAMQGLFGSVRTLISDGETRDPEVSFDGKRILFSWRGGASGSNYYHLFEMNAEDFSVRKLTTGDGNDIEAIYLPNGNILFGSTRMIQGVDCFPGIVVNEFLCDKDGGYVRRIGFDQSPTDYPQVLPSGEVVYSRWDYNDKTHTYAHALFVMNPDGTKQREYYNNNSWWPSMILMARPIPNTTRLMAMIGGYHTPQSGKVGIIDANVGMENGVGVILLAPVRLPKDDTLDPWGGGNVAQYVATWGLSAFDPAKYPHANALPMDGWGQRPPMFAYPYPFDEQSFLVSFRPASKESVWSGRFGLYFMKDDGARELLYVDYAGCASPIPLAARPVPSVLTSTVDYRKTTGVFQIMNIYISQSPVLDGVTPGTITAARCRARLPYRSGHRYLAVFCRARAHKRRRRNGGHADRQAECVVGRQDNRGRNACLQRWFRVVHRAGACPAILSSARFQRQRGADHALVDDVAARRGEQLHGMP